ncbi:FecR family protein [Puteibacter caeruleilacunae]|nr:FecR family protein [Puteibacter caeruleilacunae]
MRLFDAINLIIHQSNNHKKRMEQNDNTYQQLIEDNQFVEWVKSDFQAHNDYWNKWQQNNTESKDGFKEAIQTVQMMSFNEEQLKEEEIEQQWDHVLSKIEARKKRFTIGRIVPLLRYSAAVLLLPALLMIAYLNHQNDKIKGQFDQLAYSQQQVKHTVQAPLGSKVSVDLPDGSKVWLNSGSSITYPQLFGEERIVSMKGECYFDITKGMKPFIVQNPGAAVKVYGTEFNINAYNQDKVSVALVEGKVSLLTEDQEYFVKPGQVAMYDQQIKRVKIYKAQLDEFTCWLEGRYVFRNRTLSQILNTLEYRYNYEFVLEDKELSNYIYNAKINDVGLEQLLHMLSLSGPIRYEIERTRLSEDGVFSKGKVRIYKK